MTVQYWYQATILFLLVAGFVPAVWFVSLHRPKQWKRLAAWDASGFVIVAAAIYFRNILLIWSRWPGSPPRGIGDAVFGIVSLLVIDSLFILRIISYRSFAQRDKERADEGRDDAVT